MVLNKTFFLYKGVQLEESTELCRKLGDMAMCVQHRWRAGNVVGVSILLDAAASIRRCASR